MWGFEPQYMDMYLSTGADFIQQVQMTNPETGEPHTPPEGSTVFFRVGERIWEGTLSGSRASFKVESEETDQVRRGEPVQFCVSHGEDDWVLTQGRIIRG